MQIGNALLLCTNLFNRGERCQKNASVCQVMSNKAQEEQILLFG